MSLMLLAIITIGLVIGFATVPGYIRFLGPGVLGKSIFGKGLFILGQLGNGGSLAYVRDSGDLELLPFDKGRNEAYVDGEWVGLDEKPAVYTLGWASFVVSWEKSEKAIGEFLARFDEETAAKADGGVINLSEQRGGYRLLTRVDPDAGGYVVNVLRYAQSLGRSGNRLLNRSQEIALRKFGGDPQMSQIKFGILLAVVFVVMFATTWAFLG